MTQPIHPGATNTDEPLSTHQKAFALNLDRSKYGSVAEIGGGQETARWFFRVGGAAGTVAMTISAYDKVFSDAIYGKGERYVSRPRLEVMLNTEYQKLEDRLGAERGGDTTFFAFANTVAARSYSWKEDGTGWLGVRFQIEPGAPPSTIVIHVRMLNKESVQQQEALGILGINLIYGAMFLHHDPDALLLSLMDDVTRVRAEVNLIDFSGHGFEEVDQRIMSLKLVEHGHTDAAMFLANGEMTFPGDALYKKSILVERGSFRPVTLTNLDILNCARAQFSQEPLVEGKEVIALTEMQLSSFCLEDGTRNYGDFLERVDILSALDKNVLITNFFEFHRLAQFLFRYTQNMIGICMGVATLKEIFEEKYYEDLDGGILESFGRLFKNDLKLYAYPMEDGKGGPVISAGNLRVASHLRHLYSYLCENRFIEGLRGYDEACLPIYASDVLKKIMGGDASWEAMVPPVVAHRIMDRQLFGYSGPPPAALGRYLESRSDAAKGGGIPQQETPIVDEHQLIEASSHDPEIARVLIDGFREEISEHMVQFNERLKNSDAEGIRDTARSIRGTASTLGYLEVRAIAVKIEDASKGDDLGGCRTLVDELPGALERLGAAVEAVDFD